MLPAKTGPYKWAVLGALAVTALCLYPQLVMWATRGREWNGAYAQVHGDEWIYSAYVQALIDGRPRRNDSYTGRDDRAGEVQPESIFSIQFVPAYLIAIPARRLGVSSSTAFILLGILTPFLSCLAIFWLLHLVVRDARLAAGGAVIVLCFGALAGGQGAVHLIETGAHYIYLPFLRRYAPAAMFPLFFVFCGFVWKSLNEEGKRRFAWATAAGVSLSILVFSYFYLWTAALAWVIGLALIWLAVRREFKRTLSTLAIVLTPFLLSLIPYAILVSRRTEGLHSGLKIQFSHAPDILRAPELVGLGVVALIIVGIAKGIINWRAPEVLLAASCGLLPFLVFNQQIITGRSIQPYHYALFIANYVTLIGLFVVCILIWRGRTQETGTPLRYRRVARIVILALWWGSVEVVFHTHVIVRESKLKDPIAAACKQLRELSHTDTLSDGRNPRPLVLATHDDLAIMLPTFAPQALLWAHNFDFINIDAEENRRRFYQYLYYSGIDGAALREDISKPRSRFGTAVFGHERIIQYLATIKPKPITEDEITEEVKKYETFVASFDRAAATEHVLSYLVFPVQREPNLSNLDKWYERYEGQQVDAFKIYRLRLREMN